jgi:tetratricopeptide (TPR) repeat protein
MNYLFTLITFFLSLIVYGQADTANFNNGEDKRALAQYKEAIKYYTQAIKLNPKYVAAYKGRGICELQLQDGKGGIRDFN